MHRILLAALVGLSLSFSGLAQSSSATPHRAQANANASAALEREIDAAAQSEIIIRNRDGRVSVTVGGEEQRGITLRATSPGVPVAEADVQAISRQGGRIEIEARARGERDRIDLDLRVPARARVRVTTEGGAVDVVGNVSEAEVKTNTGTIRADVPVEALQYSFVWNASRPRVFSEVELPRPEERRGGRFEISGRMGERDASRDQRIRLRLQTERGVVLFGVADPAMVPADLRERALTEAARAIIQSGDTDLIDAIRRVAPRLVGEYAETLPRREAPTLVERRGSRDLTTTVTTQLASLNASVTDRHGRAVAGLTPRDFIIYENGERRDVTQVEPTQAPFNLVLLLDVSGSVEERLDFIRKAALAFINTVSPQDRVAIISFRDDIQLISDFTTDRALLTERVNNIQAGGATAVYDALAYTLVHLLHPLRGERTAVVLLSDGDDNRSFIPFPAVLEATVESGALIYPLYIPSGLIPATSAPAPTSTLDPTRARFLALTSRADAEGRQLAEVSGGVYYPITRIADLQRAYDDVVAQLRTSYRITYASSTAIAHGAQRRIRVSVERDGASIRLSPVVSASRNEE